MKKLNVKENTIYLVTGAAGFLGSHICDELLENGAKVRALVLPNDPSVKYIPKSVEVVEGNLCDKASLEEFIKTENGQHSIIIHCASMVTVNPDFSQKLIDINVGGTKNIIDLCLSHPECEKMVYVSSTGAIPELPKGQLIREVDHFDYEDERVVGWYSKSKAMASQEVLDAVHNKGLNACIVHPSGILGPKDYAKGLTTKNIIEIMNGELPVGMAGSFNLADVRDLAHGTVMAIEYGRRGECYILGNKETTFKEMCQTLQKEVGCRGPLFYVPIPLAYRLAKSMEKKAAKKGTQPVMSTFSVYNLDRNNTFDSSKAEKELDYHTRSYAETLRDMADWIAEAGLLKGNKTAKKSGYKAAPQN